MSPSRPGGSLVSAEDRPPPRLASAAGTAAGLFLLASLTLILSEIGGDNQRVIGVIVALLFEAIGVGLLVLDRNGRARTAGVTLTALGVVPLVTYLFVDVRNPSNTIDDVGSFTSTATLILVVAAVLWLVAYLVGPGRRYGFYLAAALVALWLVAVVQIVDNPLNQVSNSFLGAPTPSQVEVFGPEDGSFDSEFDSQFSDDFSDDFDSQFSDDFSDDFDPGSQFDEPSDVEDPSTKLGVASLIFGGAYVAAAAWRDRRGDLRMATSFFAVAAPILTVAVLLLSGTLETVGSSILALILGGVALWLGTITGRRFTSWYAMLAMVFAVLVLVDEAVGESARVSAVVLLVLGLGLALALMRLGPQHSTPVATGPSDQPWSPPGPTQPPAQAAPPWAPQPGPQPGPSPQASPTPPVAPGGEGSSSPWDRPPPT